MIAPSTTLRERFDAVLVDLDGTLLHPRSVITPRTRRAVRQLCDWGFLVVLCTGRSFHGSVAFLEELELDTALAAYNGAWIGRPGEAPWHYAPIPDDLVGTIARVEARAPFSFRHNGGRKISRVADHPLFRRVASWYHAVDLVPDEDAIPDAELMRVSCYFDDADAATEAWTTVGPAGQARLERQQYAMSIFREFEDTDLQLLEIQQRSPGKAQGLAYLEEIHGIPRERTIAIGDQANDLPMLAKAGLAVAMGNAIRPVLDVADVVLGTNEEDGIARWVEAGLALGDDAGAERS